ncbi:8659_t:CDS:2, partial [Funneliformis geosporum]
MSSPFDPETFGLLIQDTIHNSYEASSSCSPDIRQLFIQALGSSPPKSSQETIVATKHSFFHTIENNLFEITSEEILDTFVPMTSNTVTGKVFLFTYYQNHKNYKITCEFIPSSMIADVFNKKFYGIDTNLSGQQQRPFVEFPNEYQVDFEFFLKPYLDIHLAQFFIQNNQSDLFEYLNYEDEEVEVNDKKEAYPCKWTKEITEEFLRILKNKIQELERCGSISKNISKKHWQFVSKELKVLNKAHNYTDEQCA